MNIEQKILTQLDEAEQKAWDALSRYKFWMFGYWAAEWVKLNRLSGQNRPNPFRALVEMARIRHERSWIKAKERQPEQDGKYLVFTECGREVGLYKNGKWYTIGLDACDNLDWSPAYVTHWMPLPEPPEGEHEPAV